MTDCWVFNENYQGGGKGEEDEEREINIRGGFSIAEFLKKNKNKSDGGDSVSFSFFGDLAIPFGLIYSPIESNDKIEEMEMETNSCEKFDRLFYLSASDLDKSKSRKTRKKMTS
jgi:hypothetical protein